MLDLKHHVALSILRVEGHNFRGLEPFSWEVEYRQIRVSKVMS